MTSNFPPMYPNEQEKTILDAIAETSQELVWWKPEQISRGEAAANLPNKGERPWIIPPATGQFLFEKIIRNQSQSVLELGTSIGYSSVWMGFALNRTHGHLTTIEQSPNKIPVARENFKRAGLESVIELIPKSIISALQDLNPATTFDGVFLDADRGHYHEYLPILEPHLISGSWIVADNAGNMNQRMQPFLSLLDEKQWKYEIIPIDNGILVAQVP